MEVNNGSLEELRAEAITTVRRLINDMQASSYSENKLLGNILAQNYVIKGTNIRVERVAELTTSVEIDRILVYLARLKYAIKIIKSLSEMPIYMRGQKIKVIESTNDGFIHVGDYFLHVSLPKEFIIEYNVQHLKLAIYEIEKVMRKAKGILTTEIEDVDNARELQNLLTEINSKGYW